MSEAELARKAVMTAMLDTWSLGPSVADLLTDLGPVARGGDSVDIGDDDGPTVNSTETAAPETVAANRLQLIVNVPKFVNRALSMAQMAQLLNGRYAEEIARSDAGYFRADIDETIIKKMFAAMVAADHVNLAAAALTKGMMSRTEARMLSKRGVVEQDIFWLISPALVAEIQSLYPNITPPTLAEARDQGLPPARTLNGIPIYRHSGVPGFLRRKVAVTASSITGNVLTATVAAGHGLVAAQKCITTGLQANQATPTALTTAGATSITMALVSGDDADNGTGFIETASAQALLVARSRAFFASDQIVPTSTILKRTDAAGFTHQMFAHIGTAFKSGGIMAVHGELNEDD